VPAGERVTGSVVCVGGDVVVAGEVERDVVVVLGRVELSGTVGANLVTVGSDVTVRGGRVSRDLVVVLGELELQDTAVGGDIVNILGSLEQDALSRLGGQLVDVSFGSVPPFVWRMLLWIRLLHKLLIFVVLLLLVGLVPERVRRIGEEAPLRYLPAFFVGALGYLGFFTLVGLAALSLVAIPLIPLAFLLFHLLKWLGIAGLFYAIGYRLGRVAGRELSVLGAVLAVFAAYALIFAAPTLFGWFGLVLSAAASLLFLLAFAIPGLGLVMLTLAGSRGAAAPAAPHAGPG
jgi:hypothetical protein